MNTVDIILMIGVIGVLIYFGFVYKDKIISFVNFNKQPTSNDINNDQSKNFDINNNEKKEKISPIINNQNITIDNISQISIDDDDDKNLDLSFIDV